MASVYFSMALSRFFAANSVLPSLQGGGMVGWRDGGWSAGGGREKDRAIFLFPDPHSSRQEELTAHQGAWGRQYSRLQGLGGCIFRHGAFACDLASERLLYKLLKKDLEASRCHDLDPQLVFVSRSAARELYFCGGLVFSRCPPARCSFLPCLPLPPWPARSRPK